MNIPPSADSPKKILERISVVDRNILLFGESGIGKSTLASGLAQILARSGRPCLCLSADPGSPAFGPPGAVCLGQWRENGWRIMDLEALCSLDAGRFRLPLILAVRRLIGRVKSGGILLVDAPGVVRGVAGAELLMGLAEGAAIETVLALVRDSNKIPLADELEAISCDVHLVEASAKASQPSQRKRVRHRTLLWNEYLDNAEDQSISLAASPLTGTPPPSQADQDWRGRQIALFKNDRTIAIGEVLNVEKGELRVRLAATTATKPDYLLVRDAFRDNLGRLSTLKPSTALTPQYIPPPDIIPYPSVIKDTGPRPVTRIGEATSILVNGIFGDPLLHLRLHNLKRSLLFDLGEGGRLPARLAHQVTEVFISHAHIDHISGFLWLLRSRIGILPPCRLFGPPGLAEHVSGLINGIHWDRIGEFGPQFTIGEIHHDDRIIIFRLQAGKKNRGKIEERQSSAAGLIVDDPVFRVRAVTLDHGNTPVLAFSFEHADTLRVRKERQTALNLLAGSWLGELKQRIAAGNHDALVKLPDGQTETVGNLADELLLVTPGQKLIYATDVADSPANREKLVDLARGADVFFCEAAFLETDKKNALRSGHLTAKACGEIARAAEVKRLVPFHFSRRYESDPFRVYDEVRSFCDRVVLPKSTDLHSSSWPV